MPNIEFTVSTLMELLVQKVGLPKAQRTERSDVTLAELGLDSLAFIQLQAEVSDQYGVEIPDAPGCSLTTGQIVATVSSSSSYEGARS